MTPIVSRRASMNPDTQCRVKAARRLALIDHAGDARAVAAGTELVLSTGEVAEAPSRVRSLNGEPAPKVAPSVNELREVRVHLSAGAIVLASGASIPGDGKLRRIPAHEAFALMPHRAAFVDGEAEALVRLAPCETHDGPLETVRLLRPVALHFTRRTHAAGEEIALPPEDARWLIGRGEAEPFDTPRRVLEAALAEALAEARAATPERRATLAQKLAALFRP